MMIFSDTNKNLERSPAMEHLVNRHVVNNREKETRRKNQLAQKILFTSRAMAKRAGKSSYKEKSRLFSLIELLVVISMIAILAGMLLSALQRARETARNTSCISQLKQLGLAMTQYTGDFQEYFPNSTTEQNGDKTKWSWVHCLVYGSYLNSKILICPNRRPGTGEALYSHLKAMRSGMNRSGLLNYYVYPDYGTNHGYITGTDRCGGTWYKSSKIPQLMKASKTLLAVDSAKISADGKT